jgi:hypothetical protein
MTAGTILTWLLSDAGQTIVIGVGGFLWAHRWWRGKQTNEWDRTVALAKEAFNAAEALGIAEQLLGPAKYAEFRGTLNALRESVGLGKMSPALEGRIHAWVDAWAKQHKQRKVVK